LGQNFRRSGYTYVGLFRSGTIKPFGKGFPAIRSNAAALLQVQMLEQQSGYSSNLSWVQLALQC